MFGAPPARGPGSQIDDGGIALQCNITMYEAFSCVQQHLRDCSSACSGGSFQVAQLCGAMMGRADLQASVTAGLSTAVCRF